MFAWKQREMDLKQKAKIGKPELCKKERTNLWENKRKLVFGEEGKKCVGKNVRLGKCK